MSNANDDLAAKFGIDKPMKTAPAAYDSEHGEYKHDAGIKYATPKPAASPKSPFTVSGGK